MTKYTLIAEHTDLYGNPNGHKVTHEFTVDDLSSVLENTDLFLRGVGFVPDGTLDYVSDDEYYGLTELGEEFLKQYDDSIGHSEYYFDAERNK
jgi:hypothetical protein